MPKGHPIHVKHVPWHEETRGWPGWRRSKELGCTCQWWGASIAEFDEDCPIIDKHKR